MRILNMAAGKFNPLPLDDKDNMFIERDIRYWEKDENKITQYRNFNMDVFEFMERTSLKFDRVVIYRFLEHVTFTQVEYFIYLVSTVLRKNGIVDVIVPNYIQLAEMILNDNPYHSMFPEKNILLTTELLNEPSCPHASIWTPDRMKYFWELENRFRHRVSWPAFKFDGRDIYLRSQMVRL
jgi:predicted SAM-dependent methyltransferase